MTVDPDWMARIAEEMYVGAVQKHFGDSGTQSLRTTLLTIRKLYEHVPPERVKGTLVVVCPVGGDATATSIVDEGTAGNGVTPTVVTKMEHLVVELEPQGPTVNVLEVLRGGRLRLFADVAVPDYRVLSEHSIVYVFEDSQETFYIAGDVLEVVNPTRGVHPSVYAIPTFRALEDALQDYYLNFVRYCGCRILANVWMSGARVVLKNRPERTMRHSLAQFLQVALRGGAIVREEQNVDESHPVDIRVTWQLATRIALLEIKWLGDSLTRSGGLLPYRDARANEGAQQLVDYLEAEVVQTPMQYRTGYLVVYDGRRRGVQHDIDALTLEAARYYADRSVVYDPPHHELRSDFAMPFRMFMEPNTAKCTPS